MLAWKAPRAFKVLLGAVGSLILVAALVGGGWWLVHNRTQTNLAAKFDADPDSRAIPPALFIYVAQESYGARWAVFNASPDTAMRCHVRSAEFNSAGVKLHAGESWQETLEPLQKSTTHGSAGGGSMTLVVLVAGCHRDAASGSSAKAGAFEMHIEFDAAGKEVSRTCFDRVPFNSGKYKGAAHG